MKIKFLYSILAFVSLVSFTACKKDEENKPTTPTAPATGSLAIEFDHMVGSRPLVFNDTVNRYVNSEGDTFTVSMFNYYISNIRLKKTDGTEYVVPQDESYFLVVHERPETHTITLRNIPEGEYNGITFLIGVDSLRSASPESKRIGVLDIIDNRLTFGHKMYWVWNSGYIFVKFEGQSPQAPLSSGRRTFRYHIGGFGGFSSRTLNNIRTVSQTLNSGSARVRAGGRAPVFHFEVDLLQFFGNGISIRNHPNVMSTVNTSNTIADNYVRMFKLDHVHN